MQHRWLDHYNKREYRLFTSHHINTSNYTNRFPEQRLQEVSLLFSGRRYASEVFAVLVCLPVCPSIRLSQAGIVSRRPNEWS